MSVMIESPEELLTVLKKLNLKVTSVDELRQLLATINAHYNPEAARQKTGKLVGVAVPSGIATAAGITSFFLVGAGQSSNATVGGLALIWGACALVSTAAVLASAIMTGFRRGNRTSPDGPSNSRYEPREGLTGITKELS
jgi:hypothetical protein